MTFVDRIRLIITENGLKQKELAEKLGVSPSYISGLLSERNKTVSPSLAEVIENRLGYSAQWVLSGEGPKMKTMSKNAALSEIHQRAILQIERLSEPQAKAVLAFIRSLAEVETLLNP